MSQPAVPSSNAETQPALPRQPIAKSRRQIPEKCVRCAALSAAQAQALHGVAGDGCWSPSVCYSRRSYARHRDRYNQTRSRQRASQLQIIPVDVPELAEVTFAVLQLYRENREDSPVHAIGAEVWVGQNRVAAIPPIHCVGMVPRQVHFYLQRMLTTLEQHYGLKKFASQVRLDPHLCPIRPCFHHPD